MKGNKKQPREAKASFEVVARGTVPPLRPLRPAEARAASPETAADDDFDGPASKRARTHDLPGWNLAAVTFEVFPDRFATLPAAKKSVRRGEVRVSGEIRRGDYRPMPGEDIAIVTRVSSGKPLDVSDLPENLPGLEVAHEDAHFAVVVKPEGVNTVGDARGGWTCERMLPYFLAPTVGVEGALVRPRPVHRLDALTGGLLVVAKTRLALTSLSEAFASRRVTKRYRAVLCGTPAEPKEIVEHYDLPGLTSMHDEHDDSIAGAGAAALKLGVIDVPMEGKQCVSHWRVVRDAPDASMRHGRLTLVDMWPKTGRTHQLRRHAAQALGCPILGDARYNPKHSPEDDVDGLFLRAVEVTLPPSATPWRFGDGNAVDDGDGTKYLRVKVDDPAKFSARVPQA